MNKLNLNGNTIQNGSSQNGNQNTIQNLPPADCLFTIEFHSGSIAFRDLKGQYLAGTGHVSVQQDVIYLIYLLTLSNFF